MRHLFFALSLAVSLPSFAAPEPLALVGDPVHGEKLVRAAGQQAVRVDGNWLNSVGQAQAVQGLRSGKAGFPRIKSENLLDHFDALAFLQSRNTRLEDLGIDADHALIAEPELDEFAVKRLDEQVKIKADEGDKLRMFTLFKIGSAGDEQIARVAIADSKKRDLLKRDLKVGYVLFMPLNGLRGEDMEAAIATDTNMKITQVIIRDDKGELPPDLNQAARRFVGQGARGKYAALRAAGSGKAIRDLAKPLSDAFLRGVEHIYMYEVEEREYFAFDE